MEFYKVAMFALFCQAAWSTSAEETCTSSLEASGSVMLQVSDSHLDLATPKGHSNPTQKESQKSKVKSKAKSKAKTPDASNVALSNSGYSTIADMCCLYEMEEFVRRATVNENMKVCDEGGLQGIVPYFSCENKQNYSMLLAEIKDAASGLCPWAAKEGESCKKISKSCGAPMDPMSHRRRNCGRNDNSQNLDLAMQNAATNEFFESVCGTHQQYTDVASISGVLGLCKVKGDIRGNQTALRMCLKECCYTDKCIGISMTSDGTSLQENFEHATEDAGAITYLHRQR